jgi:U3 small nucleolar RNA-associated protein 14
VRGSKRQTARRHEFYRELCAVATADALDHKEEEELREHLKDCPECRQLFEDFWLISERLRKIGLQKRWEELRRLCGLPDVHDFLEDAPKAGQTK